MWNMCFSLSAPSGAGSREDPELNLCFVGALRIWPGGGGESRMRSCEECGLVSVRVFCRSK